MGGSTADGLVEDERWATGKGYHSYRAAGERPPPQKKNKKPQLSLTNMRDVSGKM